MLLLAQQFSMAGAIQLSNGQPFDFTGICVPHSQSIMACVLVSSFALSMWASERCVLFNGITTVACRRYCCRRSAIAP